MKSFIIGIGTELVRGFIIDTNGNYIARFLNSLGVDVLGIVNVGDDRSMLRKSLDFAYNNSDVIITTGGLGPTNDDITRECISEFANVEFVFSEEILEEIKSKFIAVHKEMPFSNKKQALIPKDGIVIKNRVGSAPGFIVNKNTKPIISLPGVPVEMAEMLENEVKSYIIGLLSDKNEKEFIVRVLGMPESKVDEIVNETFKGKRYGTIADYGIVDVIFYIKHEDYDREVEFIKETLSKKLLEEGTNPTIIFLKERDDISMNLRDAFLGKNLTLSVAESMTGGYLSQIITKAPNASKYFLGGIVSYSEVAKERTLNIKREDISKHFATSLEITKEMAENSSRIFGSDVSVAITGIAGPETDSSGKEIGTTFISIFSRKGNLTIAKEFKLAGNREKIRFSASMKAISMLMEFLDKGY
jgi:nicotinamide-nucleotide amidase